MKKSTLLAASAVLSVAVIAGAAQAEEKKAPAAPMTAKPPHGMMMPGQGPLSNLSEEKRKILQTAMQSTQEMHKADIEKMAKLQEELSTILTAKDFDKAAYLAKLDEMMAVQQKLGAARTAALADVAGQFTPEERAMLPMPGMKMGGGGMPAGPRGMMKKDMAPAMPAPAPEKK